MKIFNEFIQPEKTKPIWLMRQAGRYLPEYKQVRSQFKNFLEFCYNKEAITEVTLQPIERFKFDSSIIFSDILVIPDILGQKVEFKENEGPILNDFSENFLQNEPDFEKLEVVYLAIKDLRKLLPQNTGLIGFSGAPFTLSCYMIEGKTSKDYSKVKKFIYENEDLYKKLINKLTKTIVEHLKNQIEHGANIIQIFDSWSGILDYNLFNDFVIAPTKYIVKEIKNSYPNVKIIGFPRNASVYYKDYANNTGVDGISIDQNISLDWINSNINNNILIQGNLDPVILNCQNSNDVLEKNIKNILNKLKNRKHIFNLGHGIMPEAKIDNVNKMIEIVRSYE